MWLVLGRGAATVGSIGTLAETAEVLETFNGLCEVDGGVDGGGVDAADDAEDGEDEGGADVVVDLVYKVGVVEGRLIGSFPADTLFPVVHVFVRSQNMCSGSRVTSYLEN